MSGSANGATQRTAVYVSGISFRGLPVPFGCRKGPLFASSGIPGSDPETEVLPEDGALQIKFLFANIRRGIEAAGGSLEDIIKCTFHLRDEGVRQHLNRSWEASFPDPASRPARHTLMLHDFPREIAVMAEFLAVLPTN
jgi:enamine deaminase RidA (YjgF/YER057c/UK114 family)